MDSYIPFASLHHPSIPIKRTSILLTQTSQSRNKISHSSVHLHIHHLTKPLQSKIKHLHKPLSTNYLYQCSNKLLNQAFMSPFLRLNLPCPEEHHPFIPPSSHPSQTPNHNPNKSRSKLKPKCKLGNFPRFKA